MGAAESRPPCPVARLHTLSRIQRLAAIHIACLGVARRGPDLGPCPGRCKKPRNRSIARRQSAASSRSTIKNAMALLSLLKYLLQTNRRSACGLRYAKIVYARLSRRLGRVLKKMSGNSPEVKAVFFDAYQFLTSFSTVSSPCHRRD